MAITTGELLQRFQKSRRWLDGFLQERPDLKPATFGGSFLWTPEAIVRLEEALASRPDRRAKRPVA